MRRTIRLAAMVAASATVIPQHASAHAVAGSRIFVSTLRSIARGYLACSLMAHPPPRRLAALLRPLLIFLWPTPTAAIHRGKLSRSEWIEQAIRHDIDAGG